METLITKQLLIHGRVQGVGYRESMRREANRLELSGWVRNRNDGTVEAVVHGSVDAVAQITHWASRGPRFASVSTVEENEIETPNTHRFEILPSL